MAVNGTYAIEIENMGFRYAGNADVSFSGLNLKVNKGERFGLFGPNGAGKTTLISLMTGLLSADEGHIKLMGHEIGKQSNAAGIRFFRRRAWQVFPALPSRHERSGAGTGCGQGFFQCRNRERLAARTSGHYPPPKGRGKIIPAPPKPQALLCAESVAKTGPMTVRQHRHRGMIPLIEHSLSSFGEERG